MRLALLSRWLLVLAVFYAPWAYGCTNYETNLGLTVILGVTLGVWFLSSLTRFHLPRISWTLLLASLAVLILGWGMAFNGHFLHDDTHMRFIPLAHAFPRLPGSYDKFLSMTMMWRATVFIGVIWMMSDVSQDETWRKRLLMAVALAGISIAFWGLLQRALGAPSMFWSHQRHGTNFFATFRYHANAGAYLNLVLPIVAGLLIHALQRAQKHGQRALWGGGLILMIVAVVINTSRGGGVVAGLICLAFIVWQRKALWKLFGRARLWMQILILVFGIGAISTAIMSAKVEKILQRWEDLPEQMETLSNRAPAFQAWVHVLPDSGWFGTGPGTFRAVSSYYRSFGGPDVEKYWWMQAHQDYLQTVIEWGYVGAFFLAFIFFGGISILLRYLWRAPDGSSNSMLAGCLCLALFGVALHAMWDFPLQIGSIQLYTALFLGISWGNVFHRS
ncbi:MAG: O-antigen ligase family protein [Verrucomicrobiota bacterium]